MVIHSGRKRKQRREVRRIGEVCSFRYGDLEGQLGRWHLINSRSTAQAEARLLCLRSGREPCDWQGSQSSSERSSDQTVHGLTSQLKHFGPLLREGGTTGGNKPRNGRT